MNDLRDRMNDLRYASYILVPAIPVAFIVWLCASVETDKKGRVER